MQPPQTPHHKDNSSPIRGKGYPRGPAFLVIWMIFFASLCMSVLNIRHSLQTTPGTFDPIGDSLELFATNKRNETIDIHAEKTTKADGQKNSSKLANGNGNQATTDELSVSTPVFELPPLLSVVPNDTNTVISLVSMGRLVDTFNTERCIRSIRKRGMFNGFIMIYTDDNGYKKYQETTPFVDKTNRTIVIRSHDKDLFPTDAQGQLINYKQQTMIFKRFKTHHARYVAEYPELLDSIRFVVYIDVDNIIGTKMDTFFQHYAENVANRYPAAVQFHRNFTSTTIQPEGKQSNSSGSKNQNDGFGFMSMFPDKHLKKKMHGGILVYDMAYEDQCVNAWRNEMDTFPSASDQDMFLQVLGDYDRYRCAVFPLSLDYMNFATKGLMRDAMQERLGLRGKRKKPLQFPAFIHVTNHRLKMINNATIQSEFFKHLLQVETNESMTDTMSWEDAISSDAVQKGN